MSTSHALTTADIWQALDVLSDPEIPVVSLRDMGILRDVQVAPDGCVHVTITPTYSGCPAMEQIHDDIVLAVQALGAPVKVHTQLAPAWTTDWMNEQAREKLRDYGIAPPSRCQANSAVVQFASPAPRVAVACPRCGSDDTTEPSHFGSTACKALYKCLRCMEPFDYFKPY